MNKSKVFHIIYGIWFLLFFVAFSSCSKKSDSGESSPAPNQVFMENISYNPTSLTITHGTTITWVNKDNVQHTATSDNSLFDSGILNPGASFQFTFTTAGTYTYHCNFHSQMHAQVVVQ